MNGKILSFRSDTFKLGILFLLSHGLIFFNQSVGWDGYGLLNGRKEDLILDFKAYGLSELIAVLHYEMVHLSSYPILVYNISIILCTAASMILTYQVIRKIGFFTRSDVFYITALSSTLPYLYINLIGFAAVYLYLAFLFGLFCIINFTRKRSLIWRISALTLFFISFYYHSHISYYLIALVLLWYLARQKKLKTFVINHIDFILLPVVFVVIQKLSFAKYEGPKELNYNAFDMGSFISLPKNLLYSFQQSFIKLFAISANLMAQMIFFIVLLILIPVCYWLIKDRIPPAATRVNLVRKFVISKEMVILLLGLFLFFLGAFPFSLASKPPGFYENGAAYIHQCNLYLGSALMVYSLVLMLVKLKYQVAAFSVLLACFAAANMKSIILHNKQWIKEEAIMFHMRQSEPVRDNQTFLVDDNAEYLNSSYRLQISTLNGLLRRAYKNEQHRFAITRSEFFDLKQKADNFNDSLNFETENEQFSMKDYETENFDQNIIIEKTDNYLSDWNTVRLMLLSFLNKQKFELGSKEFIRLRVLPCNNCPQVIP